MHPNPFLFPLSSPHPCLAPPHKEAIQSEQSSKQNQKQIPPKQTKKTTTKTKQKFTTTENLFVSLSFLLL